MMHRIKSDGSRSERDYSSSIFHGKTWKERPGFRKFRLVISEEALYGDLFPIRLLQEIPTSVEHPAA